MAGPAHVLIVDDSALDRRLAGRLLEKRGFVTRYAADGQEALDEIARELPSLVLTDLQMPRLDGLGLVTAIRARYPKLPVVLMTAHGSEEISILALRTGAASFVPKRRLAEDLADNLDAIIGLSASAQGRTSSLDPLALHEVRFELGNDLADLPDLIGQLEADLARLDLCDQTELLQVGVALREAIVNAIHHGNLELPSALLEVDAAAFAELARVRRTQAPYADRRVRVAVSYARGEVSYTISDEGPGFDPGELPDPEDPENLERVHGRGLMLMRTFMDEVAHDPPGNVVTLRKRRAQRLPGS